MRVPCARCNCINLSDTSFAVTSLYIEKKGTVLPLCSNLDVVVRVLRFQDDHDVQKTIGNRLEMFLCKVCERVVGRNETKKARALWARKQEGGLIYQRTILYVLLQAVFISMNEAQCLNTSFIV